MAFYILDPLNLERVTHRPDGEVVASLVMDDIADLDGLVDIDRIPISPPAFGLSPDGTLRVAKGSILIDGGGSGNVYIKLKDGWVLQ